MTAKEKAPTGAATSAGAKAEKTTGRESISIPQHNTGAARPQGAISKYLLYGQQNAVPLQQLVKLSGLDNRTARRMIEIERRAGIPICSDNQTGYYLASDVAELGQFVRSMEHRAGEIWRTAQALKSANGAAENGECF